MDYQAEILNLIKLFLVEAGERYSNDGCEDMEGDILKAVKVLSPQAVEFLSTSCANICGGWELNANGEGKTLENEQTSVMAYALADAIERMMASVI